MHTRIPGKINGYDIIAAAPVLRNSSDAPASFSPDQFLILGQDLSRERPKWVTGFIEVPRAARIYDARDGWLFSRYFENGAQASQSFVNRLEYVVRTPLCEGCETRTWSLNRNGYCGDCTSAAFKADKLDGGSRLESII